MDFLCFDIMNNLYHFIVFQEVWTEMFRVWGGFEPPGYGQKSQGQNLPSQMFHLSYLQVNANSHYKFFWLKIEKWYK